MPASTVLLFRELLCKQSYGWELLTNICPCLVYCYCTCLFQNTSPRGWHSWTSSVRSSAGLCLVWTRWQRSRSPVWLLIPGRPSGGCIRSHRVQREGPGIWEPQSLLKTQHFPPGRWRGHRVDRTAAAGAGAYVRYHHGAPWLASRINITGHHCVLVNNKDLEVYNPDKDEDTEEEEPRTPLKRVAPAPDSMFIFKASNP